MRYVKVLLVCLFMTLLWAGNSVTAYADDCNPAGCDSTWIAATDTVYLTGYPNCPLVIDYEYRQCGTATDIHVFGFLWPDTTGTACDSLYARLDRRLPNGDPDWNFAFWVFQDAHKKLLVKLFERAYNGLLPGDRYLLNCPNGQKTYRTYWGACRMLALTGTGSIGAPGGPFKSWNVSCGEQCCIETTKICFDTTTQTTQAIITTASGGTGQCGTQYAVLPPGTIATSVCMPACGGLPPNYNDEETE